MDDETQRELQLAIADIGDVFEGALEYGEGLRSRLLAMGYDKEDAAKVAAAQMRVYLVGMAAALEASVKAEAAAAEGG